MLFTLV